MITPSTNSALVDLARLHRLDGVKWSRHGNDVVPAWVADMDFDQAAPIKKKMRSVIERGDLGYNFAAIDQLGEVWSLWLQRRHDVDLPTNEMRVFTGVLQAIEVVLEMVTDPGDGVITLGPIYHMFRSSITGGSRREVLVPSGPDGEVNIDALEIAATDESNKVILMSQPHNPSGHVYTIEEIQAIATIVERHDLAVISDEIWADLVYPPYQHVVSIVAEPILRDRTVTIGSASKAFNIAGMSCAVAHIGPKSIQEGLDIQFDHFHGRPSCLSAEATVAAWTECEDWLDETLALLAHNRDHLARRLHAEVPEVGYRPPQATYLAWLDFRRTSLGDDPARVLLEQAGIALSPGHEFSPDALGFARLNFATPTPILDLLIDRIVGAVQSGTGPKH